MGKTEIAIYFFILIFIIAASGFCSFSENCQDIFENYFVNSSNEIVEKTTSIMPKVITIFAILLIGRVFLYFINKAFRKYATLFGQTTRYSAPYRIVKFFTWLVMIFAALSVLVENLTVFLTSLGLVGFGVTFALQKPILNFVGWITLIFNRAYTVGDRVQVGNVRGDVVDIELMYTELDGILEKTDELSGKRVTVPNEMVLTSPVTNFTKNGAYLWDELEVTITYESNWKKGVKLLEDATINVVNKYIKPIEDSKEIERKKLDVLGFLRFGHKDEKIHENEVEKEERDREKIEEHKENRPIVRVMFKDSAIALNVRYLAYYKKLMAIKSDINNLFLKKIEKTKDVEIAYPHMQIVMKGKTK